MTDPCSQHSAKRWPWQSARIFAFGYFNLADGARSIRSSRSGQEAADIAAVCLRSFIQENYAKLDPAVNRKYLEFSDGTKSYFPTRVPRTGKFPIDEQDSTDQYASLFEDEVVKTVNLLTLPRYGLGKYQKTSPNKPIAAYLPATTS